MQAIPSCPLLAAQKSVQYLDFRTGLQAPGVWIARRLGNQTQVLEGGRGGGDRKSGTTVEEPRL